MVMMVVVDVMMVTVTLVRRMRGDRMDGSANANGVCGTRCRFCYWDIRRAVLAKVVRINQWRSDHAVHLFGRSETHRRQPLACTILGR